MVRPPYQGLLAPLHRPQEPQGHQRDEHHAQHPGSLQRPSLPQQQRYKCPLKGEQDRERYGLKFTRYASCFIPQYAKPKAKSPITLAAANINVAGLPQSNTNSFIKRPRVPISKKTKALNSMTFLMNISSSIGRIVNSSVRLPLHRPHRHLDNPTPPWLCLTTCSPPVLIFCFPLLFPPLRFFWGGRANGPS